MRTFNDVVNWLEKKQTEIFEIGIFHQDEFGTYSATEDESLEYGIAAEILKDLRSSLFGTEWTITRDLSGMS